MDGKHKLIGGIGLLRAAQFFEHHGKAMGRLVVTRIKGKRLFQIGDGRTDLDNGCTLSGDERKDCNIQQRRCAGGGYGVYRFGCSG